MLMLLRNYPLPSYKCYLGKYWCACLVTQLTNKSKQYITFANYRFLFIWRAEVVVTCLKRPAPSQFKQTLLLRYNPLFYKLMSDGNAFVYTTSSRKRFRYWVKSSYTTDQYLNLTLTNFLLLHLFKLQISVCFMSATCSRFITNQ